MGGAQSSKSSPLLSGYLFHKRPLLEEPGEKNCDLMASLWTVILGCSTFHSPLSWMSNAAQTDLIVRPLTVWDFDECPNRGYVSWLWLKTSACGWSDARWLHVNGPYHSPAVAFTNRGFTKKDKFFGSPEEGFSPCHVAIAASSTPPTLLSSFPYFWGHLVCSPLQLSSCNVPRDETLLSMMIC